VRIVYLLHASKERSIAQVNILCRMPLRILPSHAAHIMIELDKERSVAQVGYAYVLYCTTYATCMRHPLALNTLCNSYAAVFSKCLATRTQQHPSPHASKCALFQAMLHTLNTSQSVAIMIELYKQRSIAQLGYICICAILYPLYNMYAAALVKVLKALCNSYAAVFMNSGLRFCIAVYSNAW
jgi:hypothetical protein